MNEQKNNELPDTEDEPGKEEFVNEAYNNWPGERLARSIAIGIGVRGGVGPISSEDGTIVYGFNAKGIEMLGKAIDRIRKAVKSQ